MERSVTENVRKCVKVEKEVMRLVSTDSPPPALYQLYWSVHSRLYINNTAANTFFLPNLVILHSN